MPLFVAFGAAFEADGQPPGVERLDAGVDSGVLAMDAYVFSPQARPIKDSQRGESPLNDRIAART